MDVPGDLRYSSDHEWARTEGAKRVRVGITDYAQDALGDVVYVQLPNVGDRVRSGQVCGEVESTKSVSDVYAPVSGVVVEVNGELADNSQWVNAEPYGSGWLYVVEVDDEAELDALLDAGAYRSLTEG